MKNTSKNQVQSKLLSKQNEIDEIEFSPITEGLGFHHKAEVTTNRARDLAIQTSRSTQNMTTPQASLALESDQLSVFYKSSQPVDMNEVSESNVTSDQTKSDIKLASFIASTLMDLSVSALIYFALNLVISLTLSSFISFNLVLSHFLRENYLMLPIIYFFYNTFYIRVTNSTVGFKLFKMRFVSFSGKEDFSYALLASLYLLCNIVTLGALHMMSLEHFFKVAVVYERS